MLLTTTINRLAESRSCDHLNRIGKTQVRTLVTLRVGRIFIIFVFLCCRSRRVAAVVLFTLLPLQGSRLEGFVMLFSCLPL